MSGGRGVPFYCPYCAEEDLRPVEEPSGAWRCAGCLRTFAVRLVGIGVASQGPVRAETGAVTE